MPVLTTVDALWMNPGATQYDGGELRRADSAMFSGAGSALGVRGGIVRHGDSSLLATVNSSDVVTIQPGAVVIPGNAVAGTGAYRASIPASVPGTLTARSATNPRVDLIVFRALDTDVVAGHGAYAGRVEIIDGTPSATPSAPALPSMAVEIGRVSVPIQGGAAASLDLTYRTFAAAIGGVLPVTTAARLPAAAAKGEEAILLDTLVKVKWSGTEWTGAGSGSGGDVEQRGKVTVTPVANTATRKAVTFPTPYSAPPVISLTSESQLPGTRVIDTTVANVSTVGFEVVLYRKDTNATVVHWNAGPVT